MTNLITMLVIIFILAVVFMFLKLRMRGGKKLPPFEGEVKPEEIVVKGPGTEMNGLVMIFGNMFMQTLKKKPHKFDILRSMDTSIGIEDTKTKTAAVTMIFRDDRITLNDGIQSPKIYIGTDPQTLMDFQSMKKTPKEIMADEKSKALIKKIFTGELKLKGMLTNFDDFKKFTALLK